MVKYINNTTAQAMINGFKSKFGNNSALKTTSKNFVGAINELKLAIDNLPQPQDNDVLYSDGNNAIRKNKTTSNPYASPNMCTLQYTTDNGVTWQNSADPNDDSYGDHFEIDVDRTFTIDDKFFIIGSMYDEHTPESLVYTDDNGASFKVAAYQRHIHSVEKLNNGNILIVTAEGILYLTPNNDKACPVFMQCVDADSNNHFYINESKVLHYTNYNVNNKMFKEVCSIRSMNAPTIFQKGKNQPFIVVTDAVPDSSATSVYAYVGYIDYNGYNDINDTWQEKVCNIETVDNTRRIVVPVGYGDDVSETWYIPVPQDVELKPYNSALPPYRAIINDNNYYTYLGNAHSVDDYVFTHKKDNTIIIVQGSTLARIRKHVIGSKYCYTYASNYYYVSNIQYDESSNKYTAIGKKTKSKAEKNIESTDCITWTESN